MLSLRVSGFPGFSLFLVAHLFIKAVVSFQIASLRRLEKENEDTALKLEEVVRQGEWLLGKIQEALHDIALSQLTMQNNHPS